MMVVRGVPNRLAKDAWWFDDDVPQPRWLPGAFLALCVFIADCLLWSARPGIGFVVWILALALCVHVTLWSSVGPKRALHAWALLLLAVLPAVELVQFSAVIITLLGLSAFAVIMVLGRWEAPVILRAMRRLPGAGVVRVFADLLALRFAVPSKGFARGLFFDWAAPVAIGALFILLMAAANPLLDRWLAELTRFESGFSLNLGRIIFWVIMAVWVWPFLRLAKLAPSLGRPPAARAQIWRSGLLNDRSVIRALVMFNVIFAVQTVLDVGYLWGGVALPDGMTYATYAHRGAYPLLVTALLAGAFALLAQPYLAGRPVLRALLYVWIAQTVVLVVSSILRLDLYVQAYDLTRLRFAAFIWMVLVALGLILMVMQMVWRKTIGWFMRRAAGLALVAVYACAFVNVDGLIARKNLAQPDPDMWYVCNLSEGALPALIASGAECYSERPYLRTPSDWREWGYRNARLRRSLAQMEVAQ